MTEANRTDAIQGEIVHEYDGIEEADNELPRWWLAIFYLTMIFAVGYWFYYEEFAIGPSAADAYQQEMDEAAAKTGGVSNGVLVSLSSDASAVAAGQKEFSVTCAPCHEQQGQGKIGPNLTDDRWIHGGAPLDIHGIIERGAPEKGMPTWGPVLGPEKIKNLTAFILTLRNTNVPGKAPEGEAYTGP